MSTKSLIFILGAVIALIVIVVLAGMRYLRSDDDDEYEDEFDEDLHDRDDDVAAARRRATASSRGPAPSRGSDGDWHGDGDRGHRDRAEPGRGQRRSRPRADQSDRSSLARHRELDDLAPAAGSRAGWQDDSGPISGVWDEGPGADWADDARAAAGRDDRRGDDRSGAAREGRSGRNSGPHARPDGRRGAGQAGRGEDLPELRPRPGRGGKHDSGDWPGSEWDELSDVDYWAELAADKPFSSAGDLDQAPPRSERSGNRRDSDGGQSRGPARGATRAPSDRGAPDRAGAAPERGGQVWGGSDITQKLPVRAARPDRAGDDLAGIGGGRPASAMPPVRRPPADATIAMSAPRSPQPDRSWSAVPANDDPLTSPSFPKVTDDSRSYRNGRPDGGNDGYRSQPTASGGPYESSGRATRSEGRRAADSGLDYSQSQAGLYGYQADARSQYPASSQPNPADRYGANGHHGYQAGAGGYQAGGSATSQSGPHSYPGRAAASVGTPNGYPAEPPPAGYGAGNYQAPAPADGFGGRSSGSHQPLGAGYPGYGQPVDPYQLASAQYPAGYATPHPVQGRDTASYPAPSESAGGYGGPGEYAGYGHEWTADPGYQMPVGYLPGDYQAAPYVQPYPEPGDGYEPPATTGGDPYAVDPYRQSGYGGGGY